MCTQADADFFVAPLSESAANRLKHARLPTATARKADQRNEYVTGCWVTEKMARKMFSFCAHEGEISRKHNYGFRLFKKHGTAELREVDESSISTVLALPLPPRVKPMRQEVMTVIQTA